jgi:hypothetical protein
MVNLMHGILFLEEGLLKETNPSYPVFTVKVPADVGFVDDHPADIFFISYEDVDASGECGNRQSLCVVNDQLVGNPKRKV